MFRHLKHVAWGASWEDQERRPRRRSSWRRPKYNVPVNIIERETEYEVHVHAITYPKDGIKVAVVDDTLYISGKRTPDNDMPNFFLQEYPIKSFERSFDLSKERVDKANIKATHKDGILIINVPKTVAAQNPQVEIDVE